MANKASRREARKELKITETLDQVTEKGNWSEVIVKIYNLYREGEMSLRAILNPKIRSLAIQQTAIELMMLGEALETIAYHKEKEDEDILESEGDGEGSGEGPVRDGDEVSD